MNQPKKVLYLFLAMSSIVILPYAGAYFKFKGNFPTDYFEWPTVFAAPKPGFNQTVFIIVAILFFLILMLYIFPRLFGFKKVESGPKVKAPSVKFPFWFWIGLIMWAGALAALWSKSSEPKWLINWADLPLFWGFTFMLDGLVYKIRGGYSLISRVPREVVAFGVASISGWLIFEYLNLFVDEDWSYPKAGLISDNEFTMYAIFGSSGLLPMGFMWYSLFNTSEKFRNRYTNGIKLKFPEWLKTAILIITLAAMFAAPFLPDSLFFVIWIGPLFILAVALDKLGIWTPFNEISKGNWSPLMLIALTYLLQGTLCEFWNYFSGYHENGELTMTYNPDYWVYSIPYVNVLHVFEMPLVGLQGYLPFGVYCAVWWLSFSSLLNIPTVYTETGHHDV